jgi:hypothetical protein
MLQIDADATRAITPELSPGEMILWAGKPHPGIRFHKEDFFLIPFSLVWGGFTIFWTLMVLGFERPDSAPRAPAFFVFVGVCFVAIGQYFIWGRFVFADWRKKRTFYAVTNRRVIAVQCGFQRRTASAFLDTLPALELEQGRGRTGSLRFKEAEPMFYRMGTTGWDSVALGATPAFIDILEARELHQFILDLRQQSRALSIQRVS